MSSMTKEQAIKVMEEAAPGTDWSKVFTVERFLAYVILSIEFWSNPPKGTSAESACLHEAICCSLKSVQITANHINEHHKT